MNRFLDNKGKLSEQELKIKISTNREISDFL